MYIYIGCLSPNDFYRQHHTSVNPVTNCLINSSEAKASRVIIYKFPVKLPFPVYSGLQRASTSRHIHSDGVPGWPAFHHVRMCQHVFALYSALTTALDSDERWLEARKRKDKAT